MTLQEQFDILNFYINKNTGSYFTIPELVNATHAGQMSLFEDLSPRYATSQRIKDALAPFRDKYDFTTAVSGYVIVPSNRNYLKLLDLQIYYSVSDRVIYAPVPMVNEDERASRLNSQIDPVTITSPIGEQTTTRTFRLYPVGTYNGSVTFLREPVKPVYGYNVISGRVIVYDPNTSTQLEWGADWHLPILAKTLALLGINMSDDQIASYAQLKTDQNFQSTNML